MATLAGDAATGLGNLLVSGAKKLQEGVENLDDAYKWNRLGLQLSKVKKYL